MTDRDHAPARPPAPAVAGDPEPVFVEIERGAVHWRFEREFLTSDWSCRFGDGCKGILTEDTTDLQQGCCSLGAHFGDGPAGQEESRQISAMAAMLTPEQWQYHGVGTIPHRPDRPIAGVAPAVDSTDADAARDPGRELVEVAGFYGDAGRTHTRVVDGACVFLNRPGFDGGVGCALHLAALECGESPVEWKPSVCWQLPLRVDWALVDPDDPDGPETATVRRWTRDDWGEHGRGMAWCCTERSEGGEAYGGGERVVDSLADELTALSDVDVYTELRDRL